MTESDGWSTAYVTRFDKPKNTPVRKKLSPDQKIAARAAYERGVKPRQIAIRFKSTVEAVFDALKIDDDEPKDAA